MSSDRGLDTAQLLPPPQNVSLEKITHNEVNDPRPGGGMLKSNNNAESGRLSIGFGSPAQYGVEGHAHLAPFAHLVKVGLD